MSEFIVVPLDEYLGMKKKLKEAEEQSGSVSKYIELLESRAKKK